jgi:hypothetical protein
MGKKKLIAVLARKWLILAVLCAFLTSCGSGTVEIPDPLPQATPTLAAQAPAAQVSPTPAAPAEPETEIPAADLPPEITPADSPLRGPLSVIITSPLENAVVQTDRVDLTGEADPETVISIDDQIVLVGPERKFSVPLALDEGPNTIEITASDPAGNAGTVYLTVIYTPQP